MAKTKVINKNLSRQKKLAEEMIANDGRKPMSEMMARAGYAHGYCRNPQKLKGTENWNELMKIYLPDDLIAKKHEELLNAEILLTRNIYYKLTDDQILEMFNSRGYQIVDIKRFMNNCVVSYFAPDNTNRKGALELVNKLKGTYAPEKHTVFATGLENMSDEDIDQALSDKTFLLDRFKKYGQPTAKREKLERNGFGETDNFTREDNRPDINPGQGARAKQTDVNQRVSRASRSGKLKAKKGKSGNTRKAGR